jgi:hypothetical protein
MPLAYVAAGVVAAAALWYEFIWVQRYWYTISGSLYWAGRLVIEAAAGLILITGLRRIPESALSVNGIVLGVIAGASAPRIARVPAVVKSHNLNVFNLAYDRLNGPLENNIDEHSTQAQRDYCREHVRPAVIAGQLRLSDITAALREHVNGRHRMTDAERENALRFIADIEADSSTEEDKVVALVMRSWQIGAYVSMRRQLDPLPRRKYGWEKAKADARRFFGRRAKDPDDTGHR